MSRILPILFNTDMVRAILDGNKTVTRRLGHWKIVKLNVHSNEVVTATMQKENKNGIMRTHFCCGTMRELIKEFSDYCTGDILYVRETWSYDVGGIYIYKASYVEDFTGSKEIDAIGNKIKWHPSIHMPKEAACIWLKVTDVRVERLQDIIIAEIIKEGCSDLWIDAARPMKLIDVAGNKNEFTDLWNSTIKKSDLDRYGWTGNPWVWVIEFERCEKPQYPVNNRRRTNENNKMTKWLEGMRKI